MPSLDPKQKEKKKVKDGRSAPRDRIPVLTHSRNHQVGLRCLPAAAAGRLARGEAVAPRRVRWTTPKIVPSGHGRPVLRCGRVRIGPERDPVVTVEHIRQHGFLATKGDHNHRDAILDRVLSMRAPHDPGQFLQRQLLAVSGVRASRSLPRVELSMMRMSSSQPEARLEVHRRCPQGLHEFASGQGAGTKTLAGSVYIATIARAEGHRALLSIPGEVDRFLRTGSLLARCVLKHAGIYVEWRGAGGDRPIPANLNHRRVNGLESAQRLRSRLHRYVRHVLAAAEAGDICPPLPDLAHLVPDLEGLRETLACGAGLDWLRRDEAAADGIRSAHQERELASLASFAPFAGPGGFWLMQEGYRSRRCLETRVRPVVVRGHERACMLLLRARWPHATFLERVVIDWAWRGPTDEGFYVPHPEGYEANVRKLAGLRRTTLVCVDHSMVHFGSALDLDTLLRQRGCSLHAVLPSSFLHPEITRDILDEVPALSKDARRMARAADGKIGVPPHAVRRDFDSSLPEQPGLPLRLVRRTPAPPPVIVRPISIRVLKIVPIADRWRSVDVLRDPSPAAMSPVVAKPEDGETMSACRAHVLSLRTALLQSAQRQSFLCRPC